MTPDKNDYKHQQQHEWNRGIDAQQSRKDRSRCKAMIVHALDAHDTLKREKNLSY